MVNLLVTLAITVPLLANFLQPSHSIIISLVVDRLEVDRHLEQVPRNFLHSTTTSLVPDLLAAAPLVTVPSVVAPSIVASFYFDH